MGLNTPAIILNDMTHALERAPDAGRRIVRAMQIPGRPDYDTESVGVKMLQAGHSSGVQIVAVGGNTIRRLGWSNDCHDDDVTLLAKLAAHLGYRIIKKGARDKAS